MIRRSLRVGIRLGLLSGMAFALFKIVQARRPLPAEPAVDPWEPVWAPDPAEAPAAAEAPAQSPDEPDLVEPTMLRSTSLKRPTTATTEGPFDQAATAPPMVPPAAPYAPSAPSSPTIVPDPAPEIEPDDDEIVILSTGGGGQVADQDVAPPEPTPASPPATPAAEAAAPARKAAPAKKTGTKKASATKAPAKKAAAKKVPATTKAAKTAAKTAVGTNAQAWVDPEGGVCPTTHPIKAKLRSAIYHLPGMAAYARTAPDRCYRAEAAATADGLRKAAR